MGKSFEEYVQQYQPLLEVIGGILQRSQLPHLETIALRFAHAMEEDILDLKSGNERSFLVAIVTKATNEMFGAIGSLRNGALVASYHHARAILELAAALDHVYCKPSKRDRKLEKFVEYPNVAKFHCFKSWQERLEKGEVTEEQFKEGCPVSEGQFRELEKREPEWLRIWNADGADLAKIVNWHHPASIEGLFQSSEEIRMDWGNYEILCHATHLSPLGVNLIGGYSLIGFPHDDEDIDIRKVDQPICVSILAAQQIALSLCKHAKAGLIPDVLDEPPRF